MTESGEFAKKSFAERLQRFLSDKLGENFDAKIEPLTPDASTREYFRVAWNAQTAIACVYQEPFEPREQSYLDVTNLLIRAGLPVAEVYDFDGAAGVIVHEDFGDRVLRTVLENASHDEREKLINEAIVLIAEIQAASEDARAIDSIAARLAFDFEKLNWELEFFQKHYFESLRGEKLPDEDAGFLTSELKIVARELAARPRVLTHRDFHAANLMIDRANRLRIIDHQDARMGAASYDLVSLLLDRIDEPPSNDWIRTKQLHFLHGREQIGLPPLDFAEFETEFRLQTVQRCLKAIGTFAFQTAARGKTGYAQFIAPMFAVVLEAAEKLNRFPQLRRILEKQL